MPLPRDFEAVVQKFCRAIFTGDAAALAEVALPHPQLWRLAARPLDPEQREGVESDLANLQGSVLTHSAGKATVHVYLRGVLSPIALVWTAGAWRVDARWWLAALREPAEWDRSVRVFMYALMSGDEELLKRVALPVPGLDVLMGPAGPPGEMSQFESICEMMPILDLEVGEEYPSAAGAMRVTANQVNPCAKMALAQMAGGELPLRVVNVDGVWRVDATELIRIADQLLRHQPAPPISPAP